MRLAGICFLLFSFLYAAAQDTTQQVVAGRMNSVEQEHKPYVILISADGFRYDFAQRYHATNLLRFSSNGVAAHSMIPSFPSLTFPNHYTIATGLYPAHHGLLNNSFYDEDKHQSYQMSKREKVRDSSWYGGTPLWVLAEQQKMLCASFYWVGSEAAVKGTRPTYYYYYSDKININDRIQAVKSWLQLPPDQRPHFISFYLPEVDHAAHLFGPESNEAEAAVHFVDSAIGQLVNTVDSLQLPVNFIFVSDHGMTKVDVNHTIGLPAAVDTSKFIVPAGDALLQLYAKNKKDVQPTYQQLKKTAIEYDVYLATDMPGRWHFSKKDDVYNRVGDIVLVPHLPYVFSITGKKTTPGKHGFDPAIMDMHASFYAWGPAFKSNKTIGDFENVHVYPLVAKILGLTYSYNIDGKLNVLKEILK